MAVNLDTADRVEIRSHRANGAFVQQASAIGALTGPAQPRGDAQGPRPWFVAAPPPVQWPEGARGKLPCQRDPDAWFPSGGGRVPPSVAAGCDVCPIRAECLRHAVAIARATDGAGPSHGVWAGYHAPDIRRIARGESPRRVADEESPMSAMPGRPGCAHDDEDMFVSGGRVRCRRCQREAAERRAERERCSNARRASA